MSPSAAEKYQARELRLRGGRGEEGREGGGEARRMGSWGVSQHFQTVKAQGELK